MSPASNRYFSATSEKAASAYSDRDSGASRSKSHVPSRLVCHCPIEVSRRGSTGEGGGGCAGRGPYATPLDCCPSDRTFSEKPRVCPWRWSCRSPLVGGLLDVRPSCPPPVPPHAGARSMRRRGAA